MPTPRAAEAALRNSSLAASRTNLSNLAIIDLSTTSNAHRTASALRKVQYIIVVIVYHITNEILGVCVCVCIYTNASSKRIERF